MKHNLAAVSIAAALVSSPLAQADTFDLQALIAAAKQEQPMTVYASTGKIVQQAKAFSEKYGLKASGVKADAPQIIEIMSREAQAKNVRTDVAIIEDAPAGMVQLLNKGYVQSWVPDDLKGSIAARNQNPLTVVLAPNVFAYNTEHHATCPITNLWQLTEPKWRGRVAMQDPTGKPAYTDWFSQMETHYDQQIRDAYQQEFGKPLQTDEKSATAAFVKALASNGVLLTHSDNDAASAIGAPDSKTDFVGLVSTAKFRDNKQGTKLGLCNGLKPFIGWNYPSLGVVATGSKSPNSAKLFIHYLLSADGIAPQGVDGKMSTNQQVKLPADEASGIEKYRGELMVYLTTTVQEDWDSRQDWQDLWSLNYKK
ncbi:ABC transporter substrate-binding protein [Raoultella terrigena]|jgi:iron(III) transport system substrate-binding protein|uniref:ABC transporter substrate-binding protein n=1 Tax=Raoultella terrigena TaxID=577 RepID=UPI0009780671|nr:ABC transporter substrate-binding protein [Raoultella terrigena]OMP91002.1 ABC transporter substrate-binding protein [Raoultella terrigena]